MKKSLFIVFLVFLLSACNQQKHSSINKNNKIDETRLEKLISKIQSDNEINQYISDLSFSKGNSRDILSYGDKKSYPYILNAVYNDEFNKLSNEQKRQIYMSIKETINNDDSGFLGGLIACGHKINCRIYDIIVSQQNSKSKGNKYSFNVDSEELKHSYYDKNGKLHTETFERPKSTTVSSDTNSSTSNIENEQGSNGNIEIGMTQEEVIESIGKPKDINKTTTANGVSEQWVYDGYKYLYFEDGVLVTIQE